MFAVVVSSVTKSGGVAFGSSVTVHIQLTSFVDFKEQLVSDKIAKLDALSIKIFPEYFNFLALKITEYQLNLTNLNGLLNPNQNYANQEFLLES